MSPRSGREPLGLSPASRAWDLYTDIPWGLRPRLYAFVRFADYAELVLWERCSAWSCIRRVTDDAVVAAAIDIRRRRQ